MELILSVLFGLWFVISGLLYGRFVRRGIDD